MIKLRRPSSFAVWTLLAAALLLRAMVPSGWMPIAGVDGIRIELCTGAGPVQAILAPDGTVHTGDHPDDEQSPRDPCPFALGGAAPFDLPVQPALPITPATFAQQTLAALVAARRVTWRNQQPPARGPPLLA